MHGHQLHKWPLNRLGREVPSEFLLHLWMPAERLQKRLTCLLKTAFIFAAVRGRIPGWMHHTPDLVGAASLLPQEGMVQADCGLALIVRTIA